MNKKIKVLSSVMCGLLLSSNLALTSVQAKDIKNTNTGATSTKSQYEHKLYMVNNDDIIELSDKDLLDMGLYVNRKTLQVTELKNEIGIRPMDIEEGSYFENWKELNHEQVQELIYMLTATGVTTSQIQYYLTTCGFGSTAPVFWLAKFIIGSGKAALKSADQGNGVIVMRLNTNYQIFTMVPR